MAKKKRSELWAGAFVLAGLAVLLAVILWLGGSDWFRPSGQQVVFYVPEDMGSLGLQSGSFVHIGDDRIGKIERIRFQPDQQQTMYFARIDRGDFKVYADAQARVAAALIGGSKVVITDRGSQDGPLAGREHPIALSGGLDTAMLDLSLAADKVKKVINTQLDVQDPNAILWKVRDVIEKLQKTADDTTAIAASVRQQMLAGDGNSMLGKLSHAVGAIDAMASDAQPKVADTLAAIRDAAQDIRSYTKDDLSGLLVQLRQASTQILKISNDLATVSSQAKEMAVMHRWNVDEIIDNMMQVAANLKSASSEVRRSPWRLLYRPDDKELHSQNIYDAALAFANGAQQLDQAMAKMTGLAGACPEGIRADDPTLEKVRQQLKTAFEKFRAAEDALWNELGTAD